MAADERKSLASWTMWWSQAAQVALGVALVVGLGVGAKSCLVARVARSLPPGWSIVRPPSEVSCLEVVGNTMWTGGSDGLVVVDRRLGTTVPPPGPAPDLGRVNAIHADRDGRVWVAADRGVASWHGSWALEGDPGGPDVGRALSLLEVDGGLWVGGEGRIAVRAAGLWMRLELPPGLARTTVDVLASDGDGVVWVGSASPTSGGLWRRDGSSWSPVVAGVLPHPAVNAVLEDATGDLWVGTGFAGLGGAARRSAGAWSRLGPEDGLAGPKVRSLARDRRGRLWVGSEYDGVAVLDRRRWSLIRPEDGLAGREVKCVVEDPDGNLWLGTDAGLSRIAAAAVPS